MTKCKHGRIVGNVENGQGECKKLGGSVWSSMPDSVGSFRVWLMCSVTDWSYIMMCKYQHYSCMFSLSQYQHDGTLMAATASQGCWDRLSLLNVPIKDSCKTFTTKLNKLLNICMLSEGEKEFTVVFNFACVAVISNINGAFSLKCPQ